nr:MAG TPA: hypothetical protein [Caudoviricetes sp.]
MIVLQPFTKGNKNRPRYSTQLVRLQRQTIQF